MADIQIFNNPSFGEIRTTMNESGEPLFCASDVAKALGYARPADAVADHCKGVSILPTPTNGGIQQVKFIKEADVYRLVMKSKAPNAEMFQDWVCEEVLPSIRKHGGYMIAKDDETAEELMARALVIARETLKRKEQRLLEAEAKIAEDAPKVEFHDNIIASDDTCLVRELAKILTQRGFKIGQNRLYELLRNEGYLLKNGSDRNSPAQPYVEKGLFEIDRKPWKDPKTGETHIGKTSKVTSKGIKYFLRKFLGKAAVL